MATETRRAPDYFCSSAEHIKEVRPFYGMLMILLAVLYVWTLSGSAILQTWDRRIAFTVLMLLHAALYWAGPRLTVWRRRLLLYLVLQAALAFAISLLAASSNLVAGLFVFLIGAAVGVLEDLRASAIVGLAYLGLSALTWWLLWGAAAWRGWLGGLVPLAALVVLFVAMFVRQARARAQAQRLLAELEAAQRQLNEYVERVEELTLAAERQRMARELHDTLVQGLAGIGLQIEALQAELEQGHTERATTIAAQARERTRSALGEARQAIADLRSANGSAQSLLNQIRTEAERFTSATGIPCQLELPAGLPVDSHAAEQVRRFVSEGLTNIARHAHASHAAVRIVLENGSAAVAVCDDGIGFDPDAALAASGHYGLLGLRERARLAGGLLELRARPGAGATLTLRIPLEPASKPA